MIKKTVLYFYILLALIFVIKSSYLTYIQYVAWKINPLGQYLLPPHQSINYFIQYSFYRFWSHFLAALIFSLIILFLAQYLNKKRGYQHFYDEEPWFIAIAILLVGYPGWLVYFLLILAAPLVWALLELAYRTYMSYKTYKSYKPEIRRISYYYLWLALAVIAIMISKWLAQFAFWGKLTI